MFTLCVMDSRAEFLNDLYLRIVLDEKKIKLIEVSNAEKIASIPWEQIKFAFIEDNFLLSLTAEESASLQVNKLIGYCKSEKGSKESFSEKKIKFLGNIKSSTQILEVTERLENRIVQKKVDSEPPPIKSNKTPDITVAADPPFVKQEPKPAEAGSILQSRTAKIIEQDDISFNVQPPAICTEVIAVNSPKGGTGKSTFATELSTFLALTARGRSRLRVCIVDLEIGFGDVATMLNFEAKGPNMINWIRDIRTKVNSGLHCKEIRYSKGEIELFLQKKDDTGLYGLLAPLRHSESIDITAEEIGTMVESLISNGGFDFIVIDTGNDTTDATVIALDKSDYIALVVTQDISCAHCLDIFLKTMDAISFNMDKFRLVVNNVLSARETGISVDELKETFPYPCWAIIKHNPDIIRNKNHGKPVVFNKNHDMTRQLQNIVTGLCADAAIPERRSFFSTLFKKGGGA